ncbi:MAG: aminoglycoside phosphotransferase family protein [Candidatus Aminicenantes bacterium]|nr:aminoglycoside phosphotransferase family protein [Candidatus Aminicenantes bacterium]
MTGINAESAAAALSVWRIHPARIRPDLDITGSPERTLARVVVEDEAGALFILERLDPAVLERKREIARAVAALAADLPEVLPFLAAETGETVVKTEAGFFQVSRYIPGVALPRPEYLDQAWRGPALADFLVRLRRSEAAGTLASAGGSGFSLATFIRRFASRLAEHEPALLERVRPALEHLGKSLFLREDALPQAFAHGDYHPLNIVWSAEGIRAVIDWEFCGRKLELYDAAILVGCLGMEHPRALGEDIVVAAIGRLRASGAFAAESWADFFDLVLGLRFAWLSDWLKRKDAEMIDLEAVYIELLLRNKDILLRNWGL